MNLDTVRDVLRQDVLAVRRTRLVQAVVGLYVAFVGVIFWVSGLDPDFVVADAIQATVLLGFLFVPLVSLMTSYLSVAGERESGTIRFLLGYPVTRSEVVLGKHLSRLAVVWTGVVLAFVVGAVGAVVMYPEPKLAAVVTFCALTLLFAGAYVGVGTAISVTSRSRRRAMTKTFVTYFVLTLFWSRAGPTTVPKLVSGVLDIAFGVQPSGGAWEVFEALSPGEAYFQTLQLLPGEILGGTSIGGATVVVVLCLWIVLPPALGYLSFVRADID
ncbi:MAG: ABC transporter permease subunit [Halobaculum sp.]